MTSQTANTDSTGSIATVVIVLTVLLGVTVVVVIVVLVVKLRYCTNDAVNQSILILPSLFTRKQQKLKGQSYEMVDTKSKPVAESATSSLALQPTIDEIHDRSELEKDSPNKTSMMNVLYEPGKCDKPSM